MRTWNDDFENQEVMYGIYKRNLLDNFHRNVLPGLLGACNIEIRFP
jgi:hypothetical protein